MSTTGYIAARGIGLYIDGQLVGYGESCSIAGSENALNMGNKDLDGYQEVIVDEKQITISFSGIFRFDAGYGLEDIITAWMAGTEIVAKIAHENAANMYLQYKGYIADLEWTADYGNRAEMSFSVISDEELVMIDTDKQYIYYDDIMLYYAGTGVKEIYYDGTTYIRKVIESGAYKRQISTDGSSWTDLDPSYGITGSRIRRGISGGKLYLQYWDGSQWQDLEESSAGGNGYFRDGVRDSSFVVDEALTDDGFDGVEGIDWKNIYALSIP